MYSYQKVGHKTPYGDVMNIISQRLSIGQFLVIKKLMIIVANHRMIYCSKSNFPTMKVDPSLFNSIYAVIFTNTSLKNRISLN